MSCTNQVTVSQGNTFACTFTWTPGATGPADLLTTTITSSLEDRQSNVYDMTVTKAVDGLSFTVTYAGSTADWAIGLGKWDIKFVFPGSTISRTELFRVNVIDSVTV
jgi:endonuclease YncB( thermonuclease family)